MYCPLFPTEDIVFGSWRTSVLISASQQNLSQWYAIELRPLFPTTYTVFGKPKVVFESVNQQNPSMPYAIGPCAFECAPSPISNSGYNNQQAENIDSNIVNSIQKVPTLWYYWPSPFKTMITSESNSSRGKDINRQHSPTCSAWLHQIITNFSLSFSSLTQASQSPGFFIFPLFPIRSILTPYRHEAFQHIFGYSANRHGHSPYTD